MKHFVLPKPIECMTITLLKEKTIYFKKHDVS